MENYPPLNRVPLAVFVQKSAATPSHNHVLSYTYNIIIVMYVQDGANV